MEYAYHIVLKVTVSTTYKGLSTLPSQAKPKKIREKGFTNNHLGSARQRLSIKVEAQQLNGMH